MKHLQFAYSVHAKVQYSRAELDLLLSMSSRHYDFKCRKVSELGGFLYGMAVRLQFTSEITETINLTSYELDTLCKICEGARSEEEFALGLFFRQTLASVATEYERLSEPPKV